MFATVEYQVSRGQRADETTEVFLYGLSFCGHCEQGKALLEELGVPFKWVHLDLLDPEVRRPVLKKLRDFAGASVMYPVLEIDGEYTFGYNREIWSDLLRSVSQKP